jgi:putative membrane protein
MSIDAGRGARPIVTTILAGISVLLFANGAARAADKAGAPGAPSDTAAVLGKLHHANQMEIEMGKLAQKNGSSKQVKDFGKTLVQDHTAADKKVTALAKEEKIDVAAAAPPMKPDDKEKEEKLKAQKGAEFDKGFAAAMLEGHEKVIAEATSARDATSDPKLKALLGETLPVLEKHRDTAQKLTTSLGGHASAP